MTAAHATCSLDRPRVLFNWGFHDATWDIVNNRPDRRLIPMNEQYHLNQTTELARAYAAGYYAGRKAMEEQAGTERPASSEPAWIEHSHLF